jgi:hypothetical protein
MRRILVATATVALVALVAAEVGTAGREQQALMCGGESLTLTVTTTTNDRSDAWGVGTISGGTHLIPTSFSGALVDPTTDAQLFSFSQAKGNGNGQNNHATITCTGTDRPPTSSSSASASSSRPSRSRSWTASSEAPARRLMFASSTNFACPDCSLRWQPST